MKKHLIILIVLYCMNFALANDVRVKIPVNSINNGLQALVDAHNQPA